jgi:broad specificity phosphatase PhoE
MLDNNEFYLTLVRHGQSVTNMNPDLMGQEGDVPLSDLGEKQAARLFERLCGEGEIYDIVYASPYARAYRTAEIATNYNKKIVVVPELREYSAGDWTGASRAQTVTPGLMLKMAAMNQAFLPPNGESLNQVERRASIWLENEILYNKQKIDLSADKKSKGLPPPNYICFSHGMTIKCLLHYIMGFDKSFTWKVTLENTSISRLYFGKEGWRLLSINDHAHLSTLWTPNNLRG